MATERPSDEERPRLVAAADHCRRVDVQRGVAADAFRPDVRDVNRQIHRQAPFEGDVPRMDVAAIDVVDFRRVLSGRAIERHTTAAHVGSLDGRNPLLDRRVIAERLGVEELRRDVTG